jgi:hypothetical protein
MNNDLSRPLWREVMNQTNPISTIYEGRRKEIASLHDPQTKLYLKEKHKFGIQNLLPLGWAVCREEETIGGQSLEAFLNYWFVSEWAGKGAVSARRDTKFPYDYHRLTFLLENVFQVYKVDNDTFIQFNNRNEVKVITGLSHQLMSYFRFLYDYTDDYGVEIPIFKKVFDTHFWNSRDVNDNPQFRKFIDLSDGCWASFLKERDLKGEDNFTLTLMSKEAGGYQIKNKVIRVSEETPKQQSFYKKVFDCLNEHSETGKLLTNKELYVIMNEHKEFKPSVKTKQEMTSLFQKLAYKMGFHTEDKRQYVNSVRTRGHLITKLIHLQLTNNERQE